MTERTIASPTSTCPELIELAAWRDRRLDIDAAMLIELHLARCSACQELIAEGAANQSDVGAPSDGEQSIHRAIELLAAPDAVLSSARSRGRWFIHFGRGVAVAAGVALAVSGYRVGAAVRPLVQPRAPATNGSVESVLPFTFLEATASTPTVLDLYLELRQESRQESRP